LSAVDSGAPPKKWGFSPSRTWRRGVYADVVAIKVIRRGGGVGAGCNPGVVLFRYSGT